MGNYTIFQIFENPRRGRQARNFTTNVGNILNRLPNRYFSKINVGCPCMVWYGQSIISVLYSAGILAISNQEFKCYVMERVSRQKTAVKECVVENNVDNITLSGSDQIFRHRRASISRSRARGGTPILYLYVPPKGVVTLKLLIQNGVSISEALTRTGYNISNARKLYFCKQPFESIQGQIAFKNTVQCVNKQTVVLLLHTRTEYIKLAHFQYGESILGEIFSRAGCQFGVPGGTYPAAKYPSPPPPPLHPRVPGLFSSPC